MNTYINEMREWLLNMGYVDPFATDGLPEEKAEEKAEKTGELFRRFDAGELTDEEVEFLGIAQNLRQMTHTGISADKYGRLQSECSKMKRSVEMRRYVMPEAIKGEKFPSGRVKGSMADSTKHIHQLAADNRGATAKELLQLADASIIGDMLGSTFGNHVSDARKIYPKQKKPRK